MKYQNPNELMTAGATVLSTDDLATMSRRERLYRWADVLEKHGGPLSALRRIEYLTPDELRAYRAPNTPLTIAFNDPVLRNEGLAGDSLGDAMDFFEMTREEAHQLLCDCHYYGAMTGEGLAKHIRAHARWSDFRARCLRSINRLFGRAA